MKLVFGDTPSMPEDIYAMVENLIFDAATEKDCFGVTELTESRVAQTGFALGRLVDVLACRGLIDVDDVWYVASGYRQDGAEAIRLIPDDKED